MSKLTSDVRDELIYELKEKAATLGANAVVGLRWGKGLHLIFCDVYT